MDMMKELYEKVAADHALKEKFNAIISGSGEVGEAATEEKLTAFAKEAGYEISFDEMKAFFKELAEKDKSQLSDSELDLVAGGKSQAGINAILGSIFTVGIGCIYFSVSQEVMHAIDSGAGNCKDSFE